MYNVDFRGCHVSVGCLAAVFIVTILSVIAGIFGGYKIGANSENLLK